MRATTDIFSAKLGRCLLVHSRMHPVSDASGLNHHAPSTSPDAMHDDANQFPSGLPGAVAPTFEGRGSKLEFPDLQVVFWGSSWPGTGAITQSGLMAAFTTIASGPYLSGLTQYGFVGPVNVHQPIVVPGMPNISMPVLMPNVDQSPAVDDAVRSLVTNLVDNETIPNVDDNHQLLVMVVLDPAVPFPQTQDGAGQTKSVFGAHGKIEIFEFVDDNIRFAFGWVGTQAGSLGQPDQTTKTFSHELVEAITNPLPSSGWVQTSPAANANQGEIADVCTAIARVDGVTVGSYWSVADQACITPSEDRRAFLQQVQGPKTAYDGATQSAYHDFGVLCSSGVYDYVERTYQNQVSINAVLAGYQAPAIGWAMNGTPIPPGYSNLAVPATWELASGGAVGPLGLGPDHPATVLRLNTSNLTLTIDVGPNAGNVELTVKATVTEAWDTFPGASVTTTRVASVDATLTNQEIVWGSAYQDAEKQCRKNHGLSAGPVDVPLDRTDPGDPPPFIIGITPDILDALRAPLPLRFARVRQAAERVRAASPELANALDFLAMHPR